MPLTYTLARIYTSEESRHLGRPLYQEIVELMQQSEDPRPVPRHQSITGCYENGEVATFGVEVFSFNMPLEIPVIMPKTESPRLLPLLEAMVDEGLMTVEDQDVHWHKCRSR